MSTSPECSSAGTVEAALRWIYENDRIECFDCDPPHGAEIIHVGHQKTIARGPSAMKAKEALAMLSAAQAVRKPGEEHPILKQCDELHDLGFKAGWNAAIESSALVAEGFDAACDSPRMKLFVEAGLVVAVYKRDGEIGAAIRALAAQPPAARVVGAPADPVEAAQSAQHVIEGIILRRLHEKHIDGYTIEMAKEIAEAVAALPRCSAASAPPQLTDTRILAESEARFPMGLVSASAWREGAKWARAQLGSGSGPQTAASPEISRLIAKSDEQTTALDQIMTTAADNLAAANSDLKMTLEFIHHVAEYTLAVTRPQRATPSAADTSAPGQFRNG
jgi:hypothetical protein